MIGMKERKASDFIFEVVLIIVLSLILFWKLIGFAPHILAFVLPIFGVISVVPTAYMAIRSLINKKISVDFLASVALIASVFANEWVSVIFISLMLGFARAFGRYIESNTENAVKSILKLRPEKALVKEGDHMIEKPIRELVIGDIVIIRDGERVPADCIVIEGEAEFNESSITGESAPTLKRIGSRLFASSLIVFGTVNARVDKVGGDTVVEKLAALVDKFGKDKGKIVGIADRFASIYVVATLLGAIAVFFIFRDFKMVLSLLLVSCADDIAVALPMGFYGAIGSAARRGIIIKGGSSLEALSRIKSVFMDKTGTLTFGRSRVKDIIVFNKETKTSVLKAAASCSSLSIHPVSKAIVSFAAKKKVIPIQPERFFEFSGKGVLGDIEGVKIAVGRQEFMREKKFELSDKIIAEAAKWENSGRSVSFVGKSTEAIGLIVLEDELRPSAKEFISMLRLVGVTKTVMLTGDNEKIAANVSSELGIDSFRARLMPEDKAIIVEEEKALGYGVMMVGDGVNDAATLKAASVGVAMGVIGTDAAIEAADVAIMDDDLKKIPESIVISKRAMKIAKEDFIIWGVVNTIGLALVFLGFLSPEGAALYNFTTDFLPLMNSLRLFFPEKFWGK